MLILFLTSKSEDKGPQIISVKKIFYLVFFFLNFNILKFTTCSFISFISVNINSFGKFNYCELQCGKQLSWLSRTIFKGNFLLYQWRTQYPLTYLINLLIVK